nr:MAG TPA: hypothetical protein [Caudoviricetes sp.]
MPTTKQQPNQPGRKEKMGTNGAAKVITGAAAAAFAVFVVFGVAAAPSAVAATTDSITVRADILSTTTTRVCDARMVGPRQDGADGGARCGMRSHSDKDDLVRVHGGDVNTRESRITSWTHFYMPAFEDGQNGWIIGAVDAADMEATA